MSDEYDSPDPEHDNQWSRRRRRCVCAPDGDMPGRCPGPDNCPYNEPDEDEDE